MRWTTVTAPVALALAISAFCSVGAVGVTLLASGVFSTAEPSWTAEVRVFGQPVRLNVPGVVRLLTAPGVAHLLDGRSLATPSGRLDFRRDGRALVVTCAPCRLHHPRLASVPWVVSRIELHAARDDTRVSGHLALDDVRIDFVALLAADRIGLRWQLEDTEVADIYRALATIVPEARVARIEGTLRAEGSLELPGRRSSLVFHVDGLEVGGLGTEALQFGWFRIGCAGPDGAQRTLVTGDGEGPWLALDRMGPYLPAAVIAAEDQRYAAHGGIDTIEVATLLADSDGAHRGASTLTQQLARTIFTGGERSAARKLRELLYAIEMERTLGKPRILELYLNTVHWGPGLCGARAAARRYFNKNPAKLTPIEAAWLAGILRQPHTAYAEQFVPRSPDRARAEWVVLQMRDFSRRDRQRWAREPLALPAVPAAKKSRASSEAALASTMR